jgi:hypothetical protein
LKNRKRHLTSAAPPRPRELSQFEKLLVKAAGMENFMWTKITVTLTAGHPPVFAAETFGTVEDLAAALEMPK